MRFPFNKQASLKNQLYSNIDRQSYYLVLLDFERKLQLATYKILHNYFRWWFIWGQGEPDYVRNAMVLLVCIANPKVHWKKKRVNILIFHRCVLSAPWCERYFVFLTLLYVLISNISMRQCIAFNFDLFLFHLQPILAL